MSALARSFGTLLVLNNHDVANEKVLPRRNASNSANEARNPKGMKMNTIGYDFGYENGYELGYEMGVRGMIVWNAGGCVLEQGERGGEGGGEGSRGGFNSVSGRFLWNSYVYMYVCVCKRW